jgi:hypothetical protein
MIGSVIRSVGRWLSRYGADTFGHWDFLVAVACGGAAFGLAYVTAVHQSEQAVLFAEIAIGVAMTATVLAALAIFATFFDGSYRVVLEGAGGFHDALLPFVTVAVVAALAALTALMAALVAPATGDLAGAFALAVPTLFCAWTLTGSISLVELTSFHARERAELMAGVDEAKRQQQLRRAS